MSAIAKKKKTGLVKPEVVAELFCVHRNTILNWARNGLIPAVNVGKIYRFCLEDVQKAVPNLPQSMLN